MAEQRFTLAPQTIANLSRAETALVRLEDKAEDCEVRAALHRVLARLEAVSSIRIEGKSPRLRTVLKVESLLAFDGTDSAARLGRLDALDFYGAEDQQTTLEVLYYQMALGLIYRSMDAAATVTPQTLVDLHAMSRYGNLALDSGSHLRTRPYRPRTDADGRPAHMPPEPAVIPALLDDLCAFINQDVYTPIGQAAIAHFQFESIKPFKSGLDKTGRLMSHAVIHRRDLAHRLIAPIGLAPAVDTRRHAQALLPYRFGDDVAEGVDAVVSRWGDFCAEATVMSCRAADVYLDAILGLRDAWFERFGRPNRGSALETLLSLLPGHPVLTVRQASALLGKSVSSVNDALLKLEAAGIVASDDGFDRNRVYVAAEAIDMLERLEGQLIPTAPVARDSLEG